MTLARQVAAAFPADAVLEVHFADEEEPTECSVEEFAAANIADGDEAHWFVSQITAHGSITIGGGAASLATITLRLPEPEPGPCRFVRASKFDDECAACGCHYRTHDDGGASLEDDR